MRTRATLALFLAVVALGAVTVAGGAARAVDCAAWASPAGHDLAAGTRDRPFRTVRRLAESLRPGTTGCLEDGAVFAEHLVLAGQGTPSRPITITTPSGPRAVIGDGIEFLQSSRRVIVSRVSVRMSGVEPFNALPAVVQIGGFRNGLVRSEVSGGGVADKSRVCVLVEHGNVVTIDRNRIHHCGVVKDNVAIYAPGVRVATGSRATITNNTIWSTPGDGIALLTNAQRARISRNVIDGTVNGILVAGDARFTSNGNRASNNIITYVTGYAALGSNPTGKPVGVRNVITKNCVWQPGRGLFGGSGFTAPANRVVNPRYKNRPATFALEPSSPCWKARPLP